MVDLASQSYKGHPRAQNNANYLLVSPWGADIIEVLSVHIFLPSLFTIQSVCPLLLKTFPLGYFSQ